MKRKLIAATLGIAILIAAAGVTAQDQAQQFFRSVEVHAGWMWLGKSVNLYMEGATADTAQTILTTADPTADRTVTFRNATGTVALDTAEDTLVTNAIGADETGSTYFLNAAAEFVSTLPAPAIGLRYTFIVSAAPASASYTVVTTSSSNIIKGLQLVTDGNAGDSGTADDTITFVDGQAVAGDSVVVWSDGTSWFAHGESKVAAGITFTQAN